LQPPLLPEGGEFRNDLPERGEFKNNLPEGGEFEPDVFYR